MGLDMYLTKETYVKNWDFKEDKHKTTVKLNNKQRKDIKPDRVCSVTEEMGYWRKANAIHQWFVTNCQNGVDECQRTSVSMDELQELLKICRKIKADPTKANELLPTQSGFFFGSTDYDEWYMQDIVHTINVLEETIHSLNQTPKGHYAADVYYQASW